MYQSLDLFRTAGAMARHAGAQQAIVARNIANADTPGFQARTLPPFEEVYSGNSSEQMRATRPGHLRRTQDSPSFRIDEAQAGNASPNGNTVSVEDEMLRAADISREHGRALTIYRHAMTVLRTSLGRN